MRQTRRRPVAQSRSLRTLDISDLVPFSVIGGGLMGKVFEVEVSKVAINGNWYFTVRVTDGGELAIKRALQHHWRSS